MDLGRRLVRRDVRSTGTGARRLLPLLVGLTSVALAACSDESATEPETTEDPGTWVQRWNSIAIDASGLDHTPTQVGEPSRGEQMGPGRASRAMAITHIAMFEAVNSIAGQYESYIGLEPFAARPSSFLAEETHQLLKAAVAVASHDALVALFPAQKTRIDAFLMEDFAAIPDGAAEDQGAEIGRQAAEGILALRAGDGSAHAEPRVGVDYIPGDGPGEWRQDPVSAHPMAMGALWGQVTPFTLGNVVDFRVPPPPALDSPMYAAAFNEVKSMGGGDGMTTVRTPDDTFAGLYWAYDGMPSLCAPPRLYNQIAITIAKDRKTPVVELARLLALLNVSMADAGIAIWESKYYYKFWRPVTGIREADAGTGPSGLGDGNPATIGQTDFVPMGAPASNDDGPNFTPPFPAYPSGHAGFGGALFETLRNFYGTDAIPFTFVSDEYNGTTRDNQGNIRPRIPRHFSSLSEAEEENGQSRIYLGIHWSFDKTEGIEQGRRVADRVFDTMFRPKALAS